VVFARALFGLTGAVRRKSIHHPSMADVIVLRSEQRVEWMDVLARSYQSDFHHLPGYHALAEERGEGLARLFVCREGEYFIAIPLLLRPIMAVACHAGLSVDWWDATCVYGYAGPVASHPDLPGSVLVHLQIALRESLLQRRVVTVFSRLHPLIPGQARLLTGLGDCIRRGRTVAMDLTLPIEAQRAQYRKDYKRQINRLERMGASCLQDKSKVHLPRWIDLYRATMCRVHASATHRFDREYFESLVERLEPTIHLFVCLLDGELMAGGLITLCDGIVEAHFAATHDACLELSPTKLLFDQVRLWANRQHARYFHLGGGVGGQEDTLYHFKTGFSDLRPEFAIWDWVLLPEVNDQLCQEHDRWGERCRSGPINPAYRPAYRCENCPSERATGGLRDFRLRDQSI
jgi:CelD/BcsL family acetyltransferase involved in cellulose biosynthesis